MFTLLLPCILDVVKVFIIKSLFKKLWLTFENNDDKKLFKYFDILIVENFKKFGKGIQHLYIEAKANHELYFFCCNLGVLIS